MHYNGYYGSVQLDEDELIFFGKLEFIRALVSYEGNTALVSELEGRLKEVDLALKKIKENAFGTCEVGGEAIEADRLMANPAARTCKKHIEAHLPIPVI